MLVLWSFILLKIVYARFHLVETPLLFFFINYLPCHQKIIYDSTFIENETLIGNSLSGHFISHFSRLDTAFKCYKVYCPNNQDGVCHETKSLTIVFLHSFQDIENEFDRFHPHKIGFISFLYKYCVMSLSNLM
jgi:hypothetical protein